MYFIVTTAQLARVEGYYNWGSEFESLCQQNYIMVNKPENSSEFSHFLISLPQ